MLNMTSAKGWLFGSVCFTIGFALQIIVIARLACRLSHDWVGLGLYGASAVLFAICALGFFIQWRKEKQK